MSTQPSFYTDSTKEIVLSGTNGKMDKNRFVHPNDRSAMEAFDKIPGADTITRSITTGSAEKFLLAKCYAENIRVNERQLPEIYKLLRPICDKLQLGDKTPTLFIENSPVPNACTYGVSDVVVILTSSLIRDLSEKEISAVIAHECGHILCEHTLYLTAGMMLRFLGGTFLPGIVLEPFKIALAYWSRMSELSADRVGAYVSDPETMKAALLRLAGIPRYVAEQINMEEYQRQMEEYERRRERIMDKTLMNLYSTYRDHPFMVARIREIEEWTASIPYQRLVRSAAAHHSPST